MPGLGLEPRRPEGLPLLRRLRLPVPPPRLAGECYGGLRNTRSVRLPPYPYMPMSIAAGLLVGLVLGATAVWALLVRPAVEERRRLSAAVRERELRAVEAETRLEALEATFDDRLT